MVVRSEGWRGKVYSEDRLIPLEICCFPAMSTRKNVNLVLYVIALWLAIQCTPLTMKC